MAVHRRSSGAAAVQQWSTERREGPLRPLRGTFRGVLSTGRRQIELSEYHRLA